jgi:hypothetical protein
MPVESSAQRILRLWEGRHDRRKGEITESDLQRERPHYVALFCFAKPEDAEAFAERLAACNAVALPLDSDAHSRLSESSPPRSGWPWSRRWACQMFLGVVVGANQIACPVKAGENPGYV